MLTVNLCATFNYNWEKLDPCTFLGLLSLAAVAEAEGYKVTIKDPNTAFNYVREVTNLKKVAKYLIDNEPDVLGFATMCNCYPVTLRLAQECKRLLPGVLIVFGGPQASATHLATLQHFPAVDCIILGEGETAFPILLHTLEREIDWNEVPNLTWRTKSGIVQNSRAPLIADLDTLPMPAYHLNPFSFSKHRKIPIEAGRGCPYQCIFCSTSRYWGHRFRMKSVTRLVNDIRHLTKEYGVETVILVHDNFTSSPKYVRQFCRTLKKLDIKVKWGCSARIDTVDNSLAKEMAASGCIEVFYGIESGSESVQRSIKKRMNYSLVLPNAKATIRNGITFTASFITGFPEEKLNDLRCTLLLMFQLLYADNQFNSTQLHLLSPLPDTPIQQRYQKQLYFDGQPSDIAMTALSERDKSLVRRHPDIFSAFYTIPTPYLSRFFLRRISLIINIMNSSFTLFLSWKREKERLIDLILEEAANFRIDNISIFAQSKLAALKHVYRFFNTYLLPKVSQSKELKEMMLYEYWTNMVKQEGTHIEVFSYDVKQIILNISQKRYTEPLIREWHPTAYVFTYENEEVRTAKLTEPLTKILMSATDRVEAKTPYD